MTKPKTAEQRAADKAPRVPYTPDPDVLHLLDFEPVPRLVTPKNGWTPDLQREFMGRLALHGSVSRACAEVGKDRSGLNKLYNSPNGGSFRSAWHDSIEFAEKRLAAAGSDGPPPMERAPTIDRRKKRSTTSQGQSGSGEVWGQVRNEYGELEDEASFQRRGEDARDSIANKLLRSRRLYLRDISDCPGKRAAFEILTELPIDWDLAERLEPQPDEPYNIANQRQPDMILTAQSGWSFGEFGYGPDRKAQRRREIDEYRASEGLEPVDWNAPYDEDEEECE
jgi:hypothetical protein